jgi:hypothetical protein
MIVREFFKTRKDGVNLYRTYSDIEHYIIQNETGIEYADAIDVEDAPYTYTESERSINEESTRGLSDGVIQERKARRNS